MDQILELCSVGYRNAAALRHEIPAMAASSIRARRTEGEPERVYPEGAVAGRSLPGLESVLRPLANRCTCLTLLAGSGSRWVKSLRAEMARKAHSEEPSDPDLDPEAPRGLFPVANWLQGVEGSRKIPVASYSLDATDGLGRHLVVIRGYEKDIRSRILQPLGIREEMIDFFTQEAPFGKPLGHGDAAWQCRALWKGSKYVVTNFGGDANSPLTILASLLTMEALDMCGEGVDLLVPAALQPAPAYPIAFDHNGFPRSFGHAKLQGRELDPGPGFTNVGLRVYRAEALLRMVESFHDEYWRDESGYDIPGNDPAGHEFALDNVDAAFASSGRARVLACALPGELTPAKSLEEVPGFERAIAEVRREWAEFGQGA